MPNEGITLGEVMAIAQQLANERPDAVNPMDEEMCLYTALDPNAEVQHCLGGEVLLAFHLSLPSEGDGVADSPDFALLEHDAQEFLSALQRAADSGHPHPINLSIGKNVPLPWRQAFDRTVQWWEGGKMQSTEDRK